ncbi:MAG: glycosyltransferase family 1 protein [Candidatus Omnitrophota bacterium]
MKIGIDIRSTLKSSTGIGRYTINLIKALAAADTKNSYRLYSRKRIFDFKRRLPPLPGKNFSHRVDYFKRGINAVLPDMEAFHTSSFDLERPKKARYVVTIHDVIVKAYPFVHEPRTISRIEGQLKKILDDADSLIADSHNTKSDLMKFYNVDDSRIRVIYPGVSVRAGERAGGVFAGRRDGGYILFVGTLEPRKNAQGLIKAFNRLKKNFGISHKLYICGMKGWMYEDIFREYENSEFKKDIIFKGYVPDAELAGLYGNASVFAYPSFYEGFGFPIVEAFGHGAPVVTSSTSSCGEIAGDGALLVNPDNHEEIGDAILRIIRDEDLRRGLVKRGMERARVFTWENTAREFLSVLSAQGRV